MTIKLTTKASDFVPGNKQQWNFMRFLVEFKNTFDDANEKFGYNLYHDNIYDAADNSDKLKLFWDIDELPKLVCTEDGIAWWPDKNTLSECTWDFIRDERVIAILENFSNIIDGDQAELAEKVRKKKLKDIDREIAEKKASLDKLIAERDALNIQVPREVLEEKYKGKWISDSENSLYHVVSVAPSSADRLNVIVICADYSICHGSQENLTMELSACERKYIHLEDDGRIKIVDNPMQFVKHMSVDIANWLTYYIREAQNKL